VLTVSGAGTCLVTASKAGDANYNPATSTQTTVTFAKADQAITFTSTPPANPVVGNSYTVAAISDSGLPVGFSIDSSSNAGVCSISGAVVSFTAAGSCVIDADQPGNAVYVAAPQIRQAVTVAAAPSGSPGSSGSARPSGSSGSPGSSGSSAPPASSPPTGTATPTSLPSNHFSASRHIKRLSGRDFFVTVKVPGPGKVHVTVTASNSSLVTAARLRHHASGRFMVARAHATARRATTLRIRVAPNARGRLLLNNHRHHTMLRLSITYTPTGGRPHSVRYHSIPLQ
jgi:hypothetical protein